MINVEQKYVMEVKQILNQYVPELEVRVFGSRTKKNCHTYSDLDLLLIGKRKINADTIETLKDAFSESDLPFMVDIIDWNAVSDEFRKVLNKEGNGIVLKRSS